MTDNFQSTEFAIPNVVAIPALGVAFDSDASIGSTTAILVVPPKLRSGQSQFSGA